MLYLYFYKYNNLITKFKNLIFFIIGAHYEPVTVHVA